MKIRESEVTDEALFLNRRELLRMGSVGVMILGMTGEIRAFIRENEGQLKRK